MPKAKKLPSGSWRCRIMVGGKTRSFTVKDPSRQGKAECERRAMQWMLSGARTEAKKTVGKAVEDYIAFRQGSLSVTTVNAYRSLAKYAYKSIEGMDIADLSNKELQAWVDEYKRTHKPKTVANAYGLLMASLHEVTGRVFNVRLPERKKPDLYTPTDEDVHRLLELTKGTDMEKAILLAAFGTLREGEVCALTVDDIEGDTVHIRRSVARDGREYILKSPKTVNSVRSVVLPHSIIERILDGADGRIVDMRPYILSHKFHDLFDGTDIHPFRFHDLRAYSASVRHALGIPDQYIMADGGWKTDSVLKAVYRRAMEDKRREFAERANAHFEGVANSCQKDA